MSTEEKLESLERFAAKLQTEVLELRGKLRDGQHTLMRERNHWRDRAFKMLNAAKGYKESYLHACDKWAVLREQYNEMQDYYDAMQREGREQLAKARILQIGFLAAGIGLGLLLRHLF